MFFLLHALVVTGNDFGAKNLIVDSYISDTTTEELFVAGR